MINVKSLQESDSELVSLARRGDREAFGRLVLRYQELARRFALRLVQQEDCAQDLAQEAALQAYLSIGSLQDPTRFKSWLCGIVWNVCRSYIRNQSSVRKSITEAAVENSHRTVSDQHIVERHEEQQIVIEAVDSLAPLYKEVTLLFYFQQLKIPEIAMQLAVSQTAVRVRLNRARQQLKDRLLRQNPEILNERRRRTMIKVIIADIARQERKDDEGRPILLYAVVLKEEKGKRALPIWIGPFEGNAIAMGLGKFPAVRPQTFDFFAALLQSVGVKIEQVQVVALKKDIFYGIVKVSRGEKTVEVDARPSDALALALSTGSPVFVAEEVLAKAGLDVPGQAGEPKVRSGMEDILKDIRKYDWFKRQIPSKEEITKANKKLIASIFNS